METQPVSPSGLKRMPDKTLVSVEVPFRIKSTEKALATFGGEKAVSRCLNNESEHLELRLNSRIVGDRARTSSSLLLCVRRKVAGM